jgi:serine/threonine-protein kinase
LEHVLDDASDQADFPPGYTFGNYVIRERIGRGGMARVYRAEHVALSKLVALKVMDSSQQDRTAGHRRFLREGRAAAAVKHPNVVDITDVGVWQGVPYLVMELLQGYDLELYLREKGPLLDTELARLALPIIAGLAVAHDAGVVHRDLKPSNIFMARGADGDVMPKVLDFGISKHLRNNVPQPDMLATPYGEVMGTPLYLPPEGLDGSQDLTALSDQYSLGVVLYECAVGRPPVQGDTLVSLLRRIAAGDYEPPSKFRADISGSVERAIMRAMSLNPADRFPHVRELGRALWEVASPRTQLLWGRSFGTGDEESSSSPRAGLRVSRLAGIGSGPVEGSVASTHVSTRRVVSPTFVRQRRLKTLITTGCALGAIGVASAIAYRVTSMSAPPTRAGEAAAASAPVASSTASSPTASDSRVEAALKPSAPAPVTPPTVSLAAPSRAGELEPARPVQARVRAVEAAPEVSSSDASKRRTSRRAQQSARAAARATTGSARPATPVEARPVEADEREFPGLFRKDERSRAADDDDSNLGANASPLLD